jgi:hypothetical protein
MHAHLCFPKVCRTERHFRTYLSPWLGLSNRTVGRHNRRNCTRKPKYRLANVRNDLEGSDHDTHTETYGGQKDSRPICMNDEVENLAVITTHTPSLKVW